MTKKNAKPETETAPAKPAIKKSGPKVASGSAQRRLTIKTIFGKLKGIDLSAGEKKLFRIAGVATQVEHGDGDFGPWVGLRGTFAAVNAETGEVFESTRAIVPGADMMCELFEAQQREDARATLRFSGEVFAVPRENDDEGRYDIVYRSILEADSTNPALSLLEYERA